MAGGLYSATHFLGSTLVQLYLKAFLWWSHSVLLGLQKPPAHRELFSLLFRKGEQKQSPLIQPEDPWRCVTSALS